MASKTERAGGKTSKQLKHRDCLSLAVTIAINTNISGLTFLRVLIKSYRKPYKK